MMEQPNLIYIAIKMITMLAILAGGLFFTLYLLRRFKPFRALEKQNLIRIIATKHIAPKKMISVIEVCGEILVVGISQENLSFLTKIREGEGKQG